MLKRIKSNLAAMLVVTTALVGLSAVGAQPASATVGGPGAPGCYSYDTGFGRNSTGYWGWGQVNCNRMFWVVLQLKMTPRGGTSRVISEVGSNQWLSGSRPQPYKLFSHYVACTRGAGYQVVELIYFRRADGSAYQSGYFTSGSPRALC